MPICRECIDRAQKKSEHWIRKKFCHRHPVNFAAHHRGNNKRIEMADVICRKYKPAVVICVFAPDNANARDRKSTRLNSSHTVISYAVFCLKKKKKKQNNQKADSKNKDKSTEKAPYTP